MKVPSVIAALLEQQQAPLLDLCESLATSDLHL